MSAHHPERSIVVDGVSYTVPALRELIRERHALAEKNRRLGDLLRRNDLHLQRRTAALVRLIARKEAAMPCSCSDDNLPGMWSHSDFMGGDPGDRSYAERGEGWSR